MLTETPKTGCLGHRHNLRPHHRWGHRAEDDMALDILHQLPILRFWTGRRSPGRPPESSPNIAPPKIPICRLDRWHALHCQCNSITPGYYVGRRAIRLGLIPNASPNPSGRGRYSRNINLRMARHLAPLHSVGDLRLPVCSRRVRLRYRARSHRKSGPITPSYLKSFPNPTVFRLTFCSFLPKPSSTVTSTTSLFTSKQSKPFRPS